MSERTSEILSWLQPPVCVTTLTQTVFELIKYIDELESTERNALTLFDMNVATELAELKDRVSKLESALRHQQT